MSNKTIIVFTFALLISFVCPTKAALINNGGFTTDTISNLDWKRWDTTAGKSYNYVNSNFGFGGEFFGWRFATASEADNFLSQLGFAGNPTPFFIDNPESAWLSLISYMGVDTSGPIYDLVYAMVESSSIGGATTYQQLFDRAPPYFYNTPWQHAQIVYNKAEEASFLGSFLVRDSNAVIVPEPSKLSLTVLIVLLILRFYLFRADKRFY